MRHPDVVAAYARVRDRWLAQADPGPDMRGCFPWAFEEVMFGAVVWSSNQDPLRPKVITITRLGHPLGSMWVPGSRWGVDNPDSIYRVIPISGDERYRIHGRVAEKRMTENVFTLWDDGMNTIDVLSGHDLEVGPDRTFTITVDAEPANGRRNHIRSSPKAKELYIRDVMLDWATDTPNELTVERLGGPPSTPARSLDEEAVLAASYMSKFAGFTHSLSVGPLKSKPNEFNLAWSADTAGALRNQVYVAGNFQLGDEDALVVHVDDAGAAYHIVPVTNIWGTTMDIVSRTSSLNKAQAEPNRDGTYSYVVAKHDPGVHNWVDPCGLGEGVLTVRMAEFPGGRPSERLSVRSEVMRIDELRDRLPDGTRWVTPAERARQCAERAAAYKRRLPELERLDG